jgi:putative phosphoribosyl transferase
MKNTTEKELDALVPLPLIHAIHDGFRSYEGTRLAEPRPCLHCGQTDYHKHDTRPRTFAVLVTEDGFEEVTVAVQRYWCKRCEQPVDSDMFELFYEDCLYGKPIVDLCLYHAAKNPFNRVERILHTHYGIQADRDTVQRYAELFGKRVEDRTAAGQQLADRLNQQDIEADIVLGIPRGALPVARPVADALGAPLDVVVAQKMGAPNNPELAIGAVASDGTAWLNDDLIGRLGVEQDYIEQERDREADNAHQKAEQYRDEAPDLAGKTVVVVDDGIATGATAIACLRQVSDAGATRVVLAVPVGPLDSIDQIRPEADETIALKTPEDFRAVGQFYGSFDQVTDEEAIDYLDGSETSG